MSNDNQTYKKWMSNADQAYEKWQAESNWIISIDNMLATVEKSSKMSIYKVPNKLSKLKEDAYTPSIVSIGPFHHNNKAMQAFEEHKQRYMVYLFKRFSLRARSTLQDCATAILKLEKTARRCYSEEIGFDKFEFAEILLVDGCFLLELFFKHSNIENHEEHSVEDPLINNARTIATLQHDLALLENQIPFSVLETLFDIMKLRSSFTEHNVATLAFLFFKSALSLSNQAIESEASNLSGCYDHILDILHKFYSQTIVKCPETFDILELPISAKIPQSGDLQRKGLRDCATKLLKAGIHFAANTADANENLLDIKFSATDGVVTMPPLHIQEAITETIFRNLIAFEQCRRTGSTSHHIASYVFLMRSLLHSSDDVGILHEKGIIKYEFSNGGGGGGENVTSLFESICNGVVLNDFYFSKLCEDVNGYYYDRMSRWHWRRLYLNLDDNWRTTKHKWHEYMLELFSVYLKNPWTTLKVIAAVLLLIFTALQTYYTILSYFK